MVLPPLKYTCTSCLLHTFLRFSHSPLVKGCDRVECDEEYIGESSRTFGERFKEHLSAPSPIYDHLNMAGHTTIDTFSIIDREDQNLIRTIKEALNIRVNNPSLNKNIGKYP